jgi:hypothetical protein
MYDNEQQWRMHIAEVGCADAEEIVAEQSGEIRIYTFVGIAGAVLIALAFSLDMPELLDTILLSVGGVALAMGLSPVARYFGQRKMVRLWRESLNRANSAEGMALPGDSSAVRGPIIWVVIGLVAIAAAFAVTMSTTLAVALEALGGVTLVVGLTLFSRYRGQRDILGRWGKSLTRPMPIERGYPGNNG